MRSYITVANCRPQEDRNPVLTTQSGCGNQARNFNVPQRSIFFPENIKQKPEAHNNQSDVVTGPFKRGCLLQGNAQLQKQV